MRVYVMWVLEWVVLRDSLDYRFIKNKLIYVYRKVYIVFVKVYLGMKVGILYILVF